MLTFPTFFLILIIMGLLERITIVWMMLIIGVTRWPRMARLVRGEVIRIRGMDYVQAATSVGVHPARIIGRHVLPNAIGPVLVAMTFGIAGAIIVEAALSFLGFGTPPPTATWGEILFQSFRYRADWWLALFPGLAIFISVTAYNIVGEGLRDAIDPQLREGLGRLVSWCGSRGWHRDRCCRDSSQVPEPVHMGRVERTGPHRVHDLV